VYAGASNSVTQGNASRDNRSSGMYSSGVSREVDGSRSSTGPSGAQLQGAGAGEAGRGEARPDVLVGVQGEGVDAAAWACSGSLVRSERGGGGSSCQGQPGGAAVAAEAGSIQQAGGTGPGSARETKHSRGKSRNRSLGEMKESETAGQPHSRK
jgi:hypothetical protein